MDQQQQRIKDLREVPEAEAVRKLCVQITRQYLDEIKMEDELRDRMAAGHGNGMCGRVCGCIVWGVCVALYGLRGRWTWYVLELVIFVLRFSVLRFYRWISIL